MARQQLKTLLTQWLLWPLLAGLTFLLTLLAGHYSGVVEDIYSQGFYPLLATVVSWFSRLFPFSLDDLLYVLLIVYLVVSVAQIRTLRLKGLIRRILKTLSMLYVWFHVLWGFNYYREGIHERLQMEEVKTDREQFVDILRNLIDETNASYCQMESWSPDKIDLAVERSYEKLSEELNLKYPAGYRNDKSITFSGFFGSAGISGYYGPFFNEIHVNRKITGLEYPFVLAHEKAHQFGITSEAEANFYGWLVCSQSPEKALRYSANLTILRFFVNEAYNFPELPELIAGIDNRVRHDFQRIRKNWMELRNEKVDKVATKVNDTYLKTNRVEEGVKDYGGVVGLVLDYSRTPGSPPSG